MTNNHLKQSFESISPTEEQKKRMLTNILQQTASQNTSQEVSQTESKVIPFTRKARPLLAVAASLLIVVSGAITLTQLDNNHTMNSPVVPNDIQAYTNILIYNDSSYTYGEELTDLSTEDLIGPLETRENFGDDADIIWQLKGHDPKETIVLEHLGNYYLCKKMN